MPGKTEPTPEPEAQPTPALPWAAWFPGNEAPNVHVAIAHAMARVRAVGKLGQNKQDGYAFKRIDDFMTAANSALAEACVHIVPRVLTRIADDSHTTSRGNVLRWVDLEVAFDFIGPNGDLVTVTTWGEGRDASDKATNKALTAAMKYALMYALMVPTDDIQDADRDSPEANQQQQRDPEAEERARRQAELIATATADAETVDRLRADAIGHADTVAAGPTRNEYLKVTWEEAGKAGALGCTVRIPEVWAEAAGVTECSLHDLIMGARAQLPPSGETIPTDDTPEAQA